MNVDYKAVVERMEAFLKQEVDDHKRGEMMSMAEMIHGEMAARQHLAFLNALIQEETK